MTRFFTRLRANFSRSTHSLLVLGWLSACSHADSGMVTISGDAPGLDTLALRGDSLLAGTRRLPSRYDTLVARLQVSGVRRAGADGGVTAAPPAAAGLSDNPMTRRAQARGDSLARAAGAKLAAALDASGRSAVDTVRGVVTLASTAAARTVVLRTGAGANISMSGMATSGLISLLGAEVVIRGMKVAPRDIVVRDFLVRANSGVPAIDGRLENVNGSWSLKLTDGSGRKSLGTPSPALQSLVGARVWYLSSTEPIPSGVARFGLIGRR